MVCTAPTFTAEVTAQRVKLSRWFATPIAGKKVVWLGDSTTVQISPANQGGAAGLNDWYIDRFVRPTDGVLHNTTQIWQGYSGFGVNFFLNEPSRTILPAAIAAAGDLYIVSFGINDVRVGEFEQTGLTNNLRLAINALRAALPNADFVLRMPNSFLTTDVGGTQYVQPNTMAQAYTDAMRAAYRSLDNAWPNVVVYDSQKLLFGEVVQATSPFMADQIHPSVDGYIRMWGQVSLIIGEAKPVCK